MERKPWASKSLCVYSHICVLYTYAYDKSFLALLCREFSLMCDNSKRMAHAHNGTIGVDSRRSDVEHIAVLNKNTRAQYRNITSKSNPEFNNFSQFLNKRNI